MSTALAEVVLDFEQHGRDLSRLLGSGTPRRILVATTEARMLHDQPTHQTIAAIGELARGTLKASRSRISGLREAMDAVGQGPTTPPIALDDEIAWLRSYWRARSPAQVRAWEAAAGCWQLNRLIEDDSTSLPDILAAMPARAELTRLWGADAAVNAEHLDMAHRLAADPPAWAEPVPA